MSRLLPVCCFVILACAPSAAAAAIDYAQDVRPILAEKCGSCHGVLKQEAGLRLDAGELVRQGGDSGTVVATTPEESLLWRRVIALDPAERMPPEGAGTPLTA